MKRQEPESVGDILRQTLQQQGLNERLYETRAVALWPAIVGESIASMTSRPIVKNGVMNIHVENASLRHELNMNRSVIIKLINESLKRNVITGLFFR